MRPPSWLDTQDFSTRRVVTAVAWVVLLAFVWLTVVPYLSLLHERATTIRPTPAYSGLEFPRARRLVVANRSYGTWAAWYSPAGTISVSPSALSWSARRYKHLVTHEYGHALLDDVTSRGAYWSPLGLSTYEYVSEMQRDDRLPPGSRSELRTIFATYQRSSPDAYASPMWRGAMATHLTEDFGEFFAESFARWRSGETVDPAVGQALEALTR